MKPADGMAPDPKARPIGGPAGPITVAAFCNLDEPDMRVIDLKIGLGRAFRRLRADSGLTQEQAAAKVGITRTQVARLESNGSANVPTLDFLVTSFFALGGSSDELAAMVKATDAAMSR